MTILEGQRSGAHSGDAALASTRRRLPIALLGNAFMRIAGGASGVLVGLYLADLANRGALVDAALVGALGAVSFGAELFAAVPMGMLPWEPYRSAQSFSPLCRWECFPTPSRRGRS